MTGPFDDTADLHADGSMSGEFFSSSFIPSRLSVGAVSDVGKVRKENQDHFAVILRRRVQEMMLSDLSDSLFPPAEDRGYLLLVGDGIGGSDEGELASRLMIQKVWELGNHSASWVMKISDFDSQQIRQRIKAYAHQMQKVFGQPVKPGSPAINLGTTLSSVYIIGLDAIISHVGDSRVYLMRKGRLEQVTMDQTYARKLLREGHTNSEVAKYHSVLANWFGTGMKNDPEIELKHLRLEFGDKLLVCSDGLNKELSNQEIQVLLACEQSPQEITQALLEAALERGGRDNITLIVAQVERVD